MFPTIVGAASGATLLALFYFAVRTEWPASYVSWSNDYGVVVNRSLVRYATFRVGPVYLVALLCSVTAERYNGHPLVTAVTIGVLAGLTNYKHLYDFLSRPTAQSKLAVSILDVGTALAVAASGYLAGFGLPPSALDTIVPNLDEFFATFWTTAIVAILGVCLLHLSRRTATIERLVRRSQRETRRFESELKQQTAALGVSYNLAAAVMLAENLQRPNWVRRFERWKRGAGSYGVMQAQASAPITDVESIERVVTNLAAQPGSGSLDYQSLGRIIRTHNDNDELVRLVTDIYYALEQQAATPSLDRLSEQVRFNVALQRLTTPTQLSEIAQRATAEQYASVSNAIEALISQIPSIP